MTQDVEQDQPRVLTMQEALRAVLALPMRRWLTIGRRYDVTSVEVVGDVDGHMDVVMLLCANEAQRALSEAAGDQPRDQFERFEEMSFTELIQVFADRDELDEDSRPTVPDSVEVEVAEADPFPVEPRRGAGPGDDVGGGVASPVSGALVPAAAGGA